MLGRAQRLPPRRRGRDAGLRRTRDATTRSARARASEFISLDTVAEGGGSTGNLDDPQYRWLERTLKKAEEADRLVIAFGHHTLATMNNTRTDEQAGACTPPKPGCDADPRRSTPLHRGTAGAKTVRDLFLKYPNVIAYVSGHTHENRVDRLQARAAAASGRSTPPRTSTGRSRAALIEVMDNRDGTLSLFGTVLDQAAPVDAPAPGTAAVGLHPRPARRPLAASLSFNDPQRDRPDALGRRVDRNMELLLRDPRR